MLKVWIKQTTKGNERRKREKGGGEGEREKDDGEGGREEEQPPAAFYTEGPKGMVFLWVALTH